MCAAQPATLVILKLKRDPAPWCAHRTYVHMLIWHMLSAIRVYKVPKYTVRGDALQGVSLGRRRVRARTITPQPRLSSRIHARRAQRNRDALHGRDLCGVYASALLAVVVMQSSYG